MPDEKILISICIPAYKNVAFLKRLLDSISIQTYKGYEVIICDDSPDESVSNFVASYSEIQNLSFFRNPIALGTPENWNECVRKSAGEWIKIMHDDDWFSSRESLKTFHRSIVKNEKCHFFYSSYFTVDVTTEKNTYVQSSAWRRLAMQSNPSSLIAANIIGPPSVVIYKANRHFEFDKNFKWLVDIEFYSRFLQQSTGEYIGSPLVNIGVNEFQVTKSSSLVRNVEIPEYFAFFEKIGFQHLRNILVFDAWWRLFRNLEMKQVSEIRGAGYEGPVPLMLQQMLNFQSRWSNKTLLHGFVSKFLMFCSFVSCMSKNKKLL